MRIIEQLAARLAEADRRLETLLLADATSRLIQHLEGNRGAAGAPVAQMAGELAVPLERLLRIVGKLQEKGIIVDRGGTIHPADPEKLEKLKKRLLLSEEVQPTE